MGLQIVQDPKSGVGEPRTECLAWYRWPGGTKKTTRRHHLKVSSSLASASKTVLDGKRTPQRGRMRIMRSRESLDSLDTVPSAGMI
jgi:hypothetical protein